MSKWCQEMVKRVSVTHNILAFVETDLGKFGTQAGVEMTGRPTRRDVYVAALAAGGMTDVAISELLAERREVRRQDPPGIVSRIA